MPAISKFLFEHSFEAVQKGQDKSAPSMPPRNNFTAAEHEAAKKASFAGGHAAGRAEAVAEAEQVAATTLQTLAGTVKHILAQADQLHAERSRVAIAAVSTMARKLFPALAERHGVAEIEALLGECLAQLHDEPRIVVRLNDLVLDPVRRHLDRLIASLGYTGRVVLLADETLSVSDAKIEWADGGAERDTQRIWAELDAAIQRFVDKGAEPSAEPLPSPAS